MPVDLMPSREVELSPTISRVAVAPYRDRLRAFLDTQRVHEMMVNAAYAMEQEVPDEMLTLAERIWFGKERPFLSAREAWRRLKQQLEQWDIELEAEQSTLARSILGVETGDIVTAQEDGRILRISVKDVSLYADDKHVTFLISGRRFRKDGTIGKVEDTVRLHFENED